MVSLITHQRLPRRFVLAIVFNLFLILGLYYFWIWSKTHGHDGVIFAPDYSMRILHQPQSNDNIFVFEQVNPATDVLERCLSHGKPPDPLPQTVESCVDVEHPERLTLAYVRMLFGAFYLLEDVNRVLVIGFGAGSFPIALQVVAPDLKRLDIVEIDQTIVQAADDWFSFKPSERTHIYVQDGAEFLALTGRGIYDLIVVDAYDAEGQIPEAIVSHEFVANLRRGLKPGGVAAMNVYNNTAIQLGTFREKLKVKFSQVYELVDNENVVVLAVNPDGAKNSIHPNLKVIKSRVQMHKAQFEVINIDSDWLLDKFVNSTLPLPK